MQSELTVMLVAHRPLPLLELRNKFLDRHARIAAVGPFSDQPEALPDSTKHILANLKKRWTGEANLSCPDTQVPVLASLHAMSGELFPYWYLQNLQSMTGAGR